MDCLCFFLWAIAVGAAAADNGYRSVLGDPGMTSPRRRLHLESWNFCNGAEQLLPTQASPRWADCSEQYCSTGSSAGCIVKNAVLTRDNQLITGTTFPNKSFKSYKDPDLYAVEKEKYLASLCLVEDTGEPWHFWTSMVKNGNFDLSLGLCPSTSGGTRTLIRPFKQAQQAFPCFGSGCMNQPMVVHEESKLDGHGGLRGRFYGSYDLQGTARNKSFFSLDWEKNASTGSWLFHHELRVTEKYPWLMLYLRADATSGPSGGYPWDTRGMMVEVPESPNFKVVLTLNITEGGGPQSQFYLVDIGGCWKNNGQQCDGDVKTDVTRYSEMIINPSTTNWCTPTRLDLCPPYHVSANGKIIFRNDTNNFPFEAYHLYCSPSNAEFPEKPYNLCDLYSNPQPQELVQLLPHVEWGVHGYPTKKGEGWVADPRTWNLDVGGLSSRLYFYQDPGSPPAKRRWPSIDVGTEIYISESTATAKWSLSDFDVLVSSH